ERSRQALREVEPREGVANEGCRGIRHRTVLPRLGLPRLGLPRLGLLRTAGRARWSPARATTASRLRAQAVHLAPQSGHAELHGVDACHLLRVVDEADVSLLGGDDVVLRDQLLH